MDHGNNMDGMASPTNASTQKMVMTHMTFFWGKNAQILFDDWPGTRSGMYALALVIVFVLAFLVELLSHSQFINPASNHVVAGSVQTVMHTLRIGLAYLVMLAIMSFNGGVLLAAVVGHALGFFIFGSKVFKKNPPSVAKITSDLPPATC